MTAEARDVPRIDGASLGRDVVDARRPVILRGGAEDWPAAAWSIASFRALADRPVFAQQLDDAGITRYAPGSAVEMPLARFLDALEAGSRPRFYLAIGNIVNAMGRFAEPLFGELANDIRPLALGDAKLLEANLWLGPGDNVSNLHFDPIDNLLTMIAGEKDVVLFAPEDTHLLHPPDVLALQDTLHSPVDVGRPDHERFPHFRHARAWRARMKPGDTLYLPAGWWHHVTSRGINVAVNCWYETPPEALRAPPCSVRDRIDGVLFVRAVAGQLDPWCGPAFAPRALAFADRVAATLGRGDLRESEYEAVWTALAAAPACVAALALAFGLRLVDLAGLPADARAAAAEVARRALDGPVDWNAIAPDDAPLLAQRSGGIAMALFGERPTTTAEARAMLARAEPRGRPLDPAELVAALEGVRWPEPPSGPRA